MPPAGLRRGRRSESSAVRHGSGSSTVRLGRGRGRGCTGREARGLILSRRVWMGGFGQFDQEPNGMGRTRHAAACQRVRNIILAVTWVYNARWAHLPLAKWLSRTSLAGDCSPQSRMTAHEHATTLRAAPSLSSLHRPTQVPSSFESGTCTRHHSEGAVSCCALKRTLGTADK